MLRAVQVVVDEGLAKPILVGRPAVIEQRIERFGLRIKAGKRLRADQSRAGRPLPRLLAGVPPAHASAAASRRHYAKIEMRRRHTLIGAMMIHMGEADGMICGTFGTHELHLHYIDQVIGKRARRQDLRGDEPADAAATARCSSATPT